MRAHILQHTSDSPVGSTSEWLEKNKIPYQVTRFFESNPQLPKLEAFDLLIVCGGEMNVDQEDKYSWMKPEKELIRKAINSNKKVVGLCLGSQLIAEILGARVGKHPEPEVGWHDVELYPSKQFDVPKAPGSLKVFQFHGYSFDTPKGAEKIAASKACAHQGYVYGKNVVALQFHPESTKDWVVSCSKEDLPQGNFVQTSQQMVEGNKYQNDLQAWYFELLNRFM
jgi:GMP synthase (glutamine-hydrolysing)